MIGLKTACFQTIYHPDRETLSVRALRDDRQIEVLIPEKYRLKLILSEKEK